MDIQIWDKHGCVSCSIRIHTVYLFILTTMDGVPIAMEFFICTLNYPLLCLNVALVPVPVEQSTALSSALLKG